MTLLFSSLVGRHWSRDYYIHSGCVNTGNSSHDQEVYVCHPDAVLDSLSCWHFSRGRLAAPPTTCKQTCCVNSNLLLHIAAASENTFSYKYKEI